MAAKLSDLLRQAGHPGYAIDAESLESLVHELASAEPIHQANLKLCQHVGDSLRSRVAELEDAILDWHREDRNGEDQDRASMRLYDVAETIRKAKGLDLGHADRPYNQ